MDDVKDPVVETPAAAPPAARPRRRWRTFLLYLLAAIGLAAVVLLGLGWYAHSKGRAERVTIDEAAVIDSVMTDTYGKYSAAKKGWLYVGDDNTAYLMRVVQQVKIPDNPDGDELYFTASGAAVDGSENALYGVFYVHPSHAKDGGLEQANTQIQHASAHAVRPEQVRFEALSDTLWGWVIKAETDAGREVGAQTTTNTVLAPHGDGMAVLGEFLAARDASLDDCAEAKATWDGWKAHTLPDVEEKDYEAMDEPMRCDARRWTYRTDTVNGSIPVPIRVTLGGTRDGQPVKPHTWKLVFDPKSYTYTIPDELTPGDNLD